MSEISSPAHFPIAIAEDGLSAAVCTCDREWCWGGNHFPLRRPPLAFDYQTFLYHKAHCEVRAPTGSNFSGDADLPRDQNCGVAGPAHADFLQGERQPLHASKDAVRGVRISLQIFGKIPREGLRGRRKDLFQLCTYRQHPI